MLVYMIFAIMFCSSSFIGGVFILHVETWKLGEIGSQVSSTSTENLLIRMLRLETYTVSLTCNYEFKLYSKRPDSQIVDS